mmetsp:Transcript_12728/g.19708  ORF Transcript_12728/g.19708 Transcript_12728/m.19708 type:complete len:251 (+) Transcript_12728:522-1274(+)
MLFHECKTVYYCFIESRSKDIILLEEEKAFNIVTNLNILENSFNHPCKMMFAACHLSIARISIAITSETLVQLAQFISWKVVRVFIARVRMHNPFNNEFSFQRSNILSHFRNVTVLRDDDWYSIDINIRISNTLYQCLYVIKPLKYHDHDRYNWSRGIERHFSAFCIVITARGYSKTPRTDHTEILHFISCMSCVRICMFAKSHKWVIQLVPHTPTKWCNLKLLVRLVTFAFDNDTQSSSNWDIVRYALS